MLSSVLKSKTAIAVNIQIMRAFIKVRQLALERSKQIDVATLKQAFLLHIQDTKKRFAHTQEQINAITEIINEMLEKEDEHIVGKIGFR